MYLRPVTIYSKILVRLLNVNIDVKNVYRHFTVAILRSDVIEHFGSIIAITSLLESKSIPFVKSKQK